MTTIREVGIEVQNVILEKRGKVAILTINRPEQRNAMNYETWLSLKERISKVKGDDSVGVVIITGAGDKAFSAGADIQNLHERETLDVLDNIIPEVCKYIEDMPKVAIAAVNGFCLGGGLELALACDIRVASENARFGLPELKLGILPGGGGTQRLSKVIGIGKAKHMILTGEIISAGEALQVGLVTKVGDQEYLMSIAEAVAGEILKMGPVAVRLAKTVINMTMETGLSSGLMLERLAQTVAFASEDRVIGSGAFLRGEQPQFKGK